MGTDIHIAVETFDGQRWNSVTKFEDKYGEGFLSPVSEVYNGRNYNLFAILANVRNGRGFAGVKTGDGFNFISEPRGVPEDASPEVREWMERGDHDLSWLTVAEIMAFDWTQITTLQGIVDLKQWARWKADGEPQEWSGGISGPQIIVHPIEDVDNAWEACGAPALWDIVWERNGALDKLTRELGPGSHFTSVRWDKPYYACAEEFLGQTLPQLWRLGKPEDVRICFWFDS